MPDQPFRPMVSEIAKLNEQHARNLGYPSYEAWIESKAGASPPDWECDPGAHEFVTTAECHGMFMRECRLCGFPEHKLSEVDTGFTVYDVPVNPEDPNCSSFRGRRVTRSDDLPYIDSDEVEDIPECWDTRDSDDPGDWPFPAKPPYEADDEDKAVPDE